MAEIRVELTDHMGSDLKVCQMAKDSFGRTTEWEYMECEYPQTASHERNGWTFVKTMEDGISQQLRRLNARDQDLLKMLARGMGQREYAEIVEQISITNNPSIIKHLLWKFRHTTPHLAPFGHCFATFKFKAPVFVMRQVVKHEYLRISELSMRYVRGMPEYFRPKSWRAMAENVKQGSGGELDSVYQYTLNLHCESLYDEDKWDYEDNLEMGLAPEQARMFLRLCHMTEGHFSGSMDAIAGLVIKRLDPHAQEETREFARQVDKHMAKIYPLAWAALTEGVVR